MFQFSNDCRKTEFPVRKCLSIVSLLLGFGLFAITGCTQEQQEEVERAARLETEEDVATIDSPDVDGTPEGAREVPVPAPREVAGPPSEQVASLESSDLASVSRDDYIAEINRRLGEVDQNIADLQEQSGDVSELARKRWNKTMDELTDHRAELKKRLEELIAAEGELWADFRPSVTAGWHQLEQVVERANRQFQLFTGSN